MAQTTTRHEALPQLATLPERVSVLEVRVETLNDKADELKEDISTLHAGIQETLKGMQEASSTQHAELGKKIKELEGIKTTWTLYAAIAIAFLAGAGLVHNSSFASILKFLGI